ncbi:hypothetical protein JTE90_014613 [Oedothorax gibbosus]|uniref:Uncharacterized protein n=1 Tax=Oedothorax gibbosus TaxID=931172 RepID=A0AAV6V9Q5_9ARAC|nr:hypothetical protein JTE90_014613 [Oedothorax gibbosus]
MTGLYVCIPQRDILDPALPNTWHIPGEHKQAKPTCYQDTGTLFLMPPACLSILQFTFSRLQCAHLHADTSHAHRTRPRFTCIGVDFSYRSSHLIMSHLTLDWDRKG